MTTVKITELTNIGANLATSTVVPVVNMAGTPTTQKTTVGNIANLILEGAGTDYPEASVALLAQTVSNAAQPNITSTGTLTGLTVSGNTNLGAVANVRITGGTAGQILSTDGAGNLSWASDSGGSYGNSNVAAYLPTYTGNVGANWVIASYFMGNAHNLTYLPGANVNGAVAYATTANSVAGANVSGAVTYATTANSVAAANVSGLGNVALSNYDGNASNVLHGDGSWSADTTTYSNSNVASFLAAFGSNTITTTGNISVGNITATNLGNVALVNFDGNSSNVLYGNGVFDGVGSPFNQDLNTTDSVTFANITSTEAIRFSNSGNIVGAMGYAPNYVSIDGYGSNSVNITANDVYSWSFDGAGNLNLPTNGDINFNGGNIWQIQNKNFNIRVTDQDDDDWAIYNRVNDGNATLQSQTRLYKNAFQIQTDIANLNYGWTFDNQGRFNLPGNINGIYGGNTSFYTYDNGSGGLVEMKTISYIGDTLLSNVTVAQNNVAISTSNAAYTWHFDYTGILTLPDGAIIDTTGNNFEVRAVENVNLEANAVVNIYTDGSGNAYQWQFGDDGNLILAGGNSVIFSTANSSLDPTLPNVSTMTLTPDANYNSQVLVLDPTAPGHIHLRAHAFSNIDDPAANIFLGGENTSFEVTSGSNNVAKIHSGGNTWTFANTGILTVPGEGIIQSINDTVILQSVDANSNVYSARLGTNGGLYFATTQYPLGWLDITNNSGNANITAATGTAGGAGKHIYINAGAADQSDFYTTAGGNINITGGLGAFNDGGGGGPGGSINLIAGNSADPAGVAGSINITSGSSAWTFNNAGQITLPGNQGYIGPSVVGNPDLRIYNDQSSGFVRLGWQPGAVLTPGANVASNVTLDSSGFTVTTTSDSFSTTKDWVFDTAGNLTLPGNTFSVNYANGTQVSLGSSYGDSNVVSLLSSFGSNTITTTGNVSVGNIAGSTNGYTLGYLNIPQVAASNATLALGDAGKHYYSTTAGNLTLTVPLNSSVAFPTGTAISIVVQAAGNVLVNAAAGVTLYMAGNSTAANRVVGTYGMATLMKVASDTWFINGTGVS